MERPQNADMRPPQAQGSRVPARRLLDKSEAYSWLMDRVSSMNLVVLVERERAWDADLVRSALHSVRATDWLLRAKVEPAQTPGRLCFVEVADSRIEFRQRQVASSAWEPWVEADLQRRFEPGAAPLVRCTQLTCSGDAKACLMLTFHHCITDGRAAADLVRRMVDHMMVAHTEGSSPDTSGPCRDVPPMHGVFPQQFRWDDRPGALRKLASALWREVAQGGDLTPLPWFRVARDRTKVPRLARVWIGEDALAGLRHELQRRGVSMHGVLCAAQLVAQARVLDADAPVKLLLTCPVDMRKHVDFDAGTAPSQLYASMVYAAWTVVPATRVWDLARSVMTHTRAQLARGDAHAFYSARDVARALADPSDQTAFEEMLGAVPHGSVLSAIGSLPLIESDPLVKSVSIVFCSTPRHVIFSAASSYGRQMVVNVAFDDGSLEPGVGARLAKELRRVLIEASGVADGACE